MGIWFDEMHTVRRKSFTQKDLCLCGYAQICFFSCNKFIFLRRNSIFLPLCIKNAPTQASHGRGGVSHALAPTVPHNTNSLATAEMGVGRASRNDSFHSWNCPTAIKLLQQISACSYHLGLCHLSIHPTFPLLLIRLRILLCNNYGNKSVTR